MINGLLQPGEIQTIIIDTPFNAKMNSNSWNFSHANGTVKPQKVASSMRRRPRRPPARSRRQVTGEVRRAIQNSESEN